MVADGQIVLKAEGLQYHTVPHWERESQLIIVGGWVGEELMSHMSLATMGTQKPWALGPWLGLTHPLDMHPWLRAQRNMQVWV